MFTDEQKEIIHQPLKHTVIFAAPGSGKTTVLTHHVFEVIRNGLVPPSRVLAMTFTRQAALEMKSRLARPGLLKTHYLQMLRIGTFHGQLFRFLLQRQSDIPVLLNRTEQYQLMKSTVQNYGEPVSRVPHWLNVASNAKSVWPQTPPKSKLAKQILYGYEHLKRRNRRWDFDDILIAFSQACSDTSVLQQFNLQIDYLLVDEFQDVNQIQWFITTELARTQGCPVFVVGDDDQSIYGFRGASPTWLLGFDKWFPNTLRRQLTTNFRSDAQIVERALALIRHNQTRAEKPIVGSHCQPGVCRALRWRDEESETRGVARFIRSSHRDAEPRTIAVLARTRQQLAKFWAVYARLRTDIGIQLRTFHDAKGKEWDVVHILGAARKNPYLAHDGEDTDAEEERRLFYVAMTRARHELYVHVPDYMNGKRVRAALYVAEAGLTATKGSLKTVD